MRDRAVVHDAAVRGMMGFVHALEQVKERKDEDPDQIDKVPEKTGHLNPVGQVFGIAFVEIRADRQPEIE